MAVTGFICYGELKLLFVWYDVCGVEAGLFFREGYDRA